MARVSNLRHGTWDEARALLGTTLAVFDGADTVNVADIRRKLEAIGWDCPLHTDEQIAQANGYETIVSPVSMNRTWTMPTYWKPGEQRIGSELMSTPLAAALVPGIGDSLIATNARTEYLLPTYPGDRIRATARLVSLEEKQTRLGPGAFFTVETSYTNQHDELIALETVTLLRYQQAKQQ